MQTVNMNIVHQNYSLKKHNTFNFEVSSDYYFAFDNLDALHKLLDNSVYKNMPMLILGGGSNILFTKKYEGIVVQSMIKGINTIFESEEYIFLKVQSGEIWDDLVEYAVSYNLGGIENLSGIPGSVGACPIQNIGAYGTEVKDSITEVEVLDLISKKILIFSNSDCRFSYRDSIFKNEKKGRYLIVSVTFRLTKKHMFNTCYGDIEKELLLIGETNLKNIRQAVLNIRSKKLPDPSVLGNAGSFFKNPVISKDVAEIFIKDYPQVPLYSTTTDSVKIPAAWLIEQCGWKGKRTGNVGVHDKQALVLVNYGEASGAEVLSLAKNIIHSVQEKFNITISPEVNVY